MSEAPFKHVYLVDGSGFIFRAFHALPPMSNPDGVPVNAVFGFITMLMKLLTESDADRLAVIFDAGRATFRNEIYPDYKAHRPDPPEELIPQFSLIRDAVRAFNVSCVEMPGFEADDLIATYARQAAEMGAKVTIVSSDKDLMQLVGGRVGMFDPMKNRQIGPAEVFEKFSVSPDKVVDVQALAGDPTDNVPGVPGIGVKTAAQLINEYGDLDTLLARAGEIKQPKRRETLQSNAEAARISRQLVRLRNDVPVPEPLENFTVREPDRDVLLGFIDQQGFRSIRARLTNGQPAPAAGKPLSAPDSRISGAVVMPEATPGPVPAPVATDYELVVEIAALDRWIAAGRKAGIVAVDTETNSLDPLRCDLVGVSLALAPGRACYIPVLHNGGAAQGSLDLGGPEPGADGPKPLPKADIVKRLKLLLEDPAVLKVGHNIKFDLQVLGSCGLAVAPIDDTMLLSYVLESGAHGHGMDELSALYLGHKTITYGEVCGTGKAQITFDRVPLDKALAYAAEDADITLRLHGVLKPRLVAEHLVTVYETLERPLVPVLAAMERAGIKVDKAELQSMSVEFGRRMSDFERDICLLAGVEFNIGSPKQLGEILFEKLNLPGGKKSAKTGAWGTGADVLEQLAPLHPLPRKVLDWRQLAKLKSTYADALVDQINPATGRVHTSYAMAITSTGRLSSSDPNLQNIPIRTEEGRRIRRAFIAEPGFKLLSADYSQIELRLVAHVAGIQGLIEAFKNGADIHAITASQVFGVPVEGMDQSIRRKAKAINFGIIYGISAFGLAQQLGISNGEAKQYIDAYFARYPEIRHYMDRTKEQVKKQGWVETLFGRKCFVPGINDRNPAMRAFAERAAINAPIQGGAADIIKRAMIRLPDALAAEGLTARMLLQVHDELVFEVPEAEIEATRAVVKRVMEAAASLDVPLLVEVGVAASWAEAH
ncbi:DNA polymerase I [Telmatospirillum siberiense]|uniref:DNA polymerase I n=1 Tax=Telmatospirillum siberiense TaxID=382514 RepID=A0A2N3PXY9_9PROT|nr:DNA polymerase I [Telmatospirillum siberiense]PKU25235.1 DNA polymerase I [Telmatospirillum siberiense]